MRHNDAGRLPGSGPVWRFNAEWEAEGANGTKTGVEENYVDDRQDFEMRASVPESGCNGVRLRVHNFSCQLRALLGAERQVLLSNAQAIAKAWRTAAFNLNPSRFQY